MKSLYLKSKGLLFFTLIAVYILSILVNTTSCEQKNGNKIERDDIIIAEDRDIQLDQSLVSLDINGGSLFYTDGGKIFQYDISSGERIEKISDLTGAKSICAISDKIYIYDSDKNCVVEYDGEYNITNEYILNEKIGVSIKLIKLSDTILILHGEQDKNYASKIYKINTKDNAQGNIDLKSGDLYISDILFMDENNILILYFNMMGIENLLKYNFREETKGFTINDIQTSNVCYDMKSGYIYLFRAYGLQRETCEILKADITDGNLNIISTKKVKSHNLEAAKRFYTNDSGYIICYSDNFVVFRKFTEDKKNILNIYQYGSGLTWFDESVRGFQEDYGVEINISSHEDNLFEKIKLKLLANDIDFDLFMIDSAVGIEIFNKGAYEPLDNYPGLMKNISEMYPGMQKLLDYDGKTIGIPMQSVTSYAYAFNEKLAEKYDIEPPEIKNGKWTIDEFYEYAKYVREKSNGEAWLSANYDADSYLSLWNYVSAYVDSQTGKLTDDGDNLKKYILWCRKMADENLFWKTKDNFNYENVLLDWSRSNFTIRDELLIPAPVINETAKNGIRFWLLCVNKYSPNKELAAQFLEYMISEEYRYANMAPILYDAIDKYQVYKMNATQITNRMRYNSEFLNTIYENSMLEFQIQDVKFYEFSTDLFSEYLKDAITIDNITNEIYNKLKIITGE